MRMFEATRECTLTTDLVCSMIAISENATLVTIMKMNPQCSYEKQEYQDFHSLTLVICDTSTISAKVRVLLREKRHFQVDIEHSYLPIWQ